MPTMKSRSSISKPASTKRTTRRAPAPASSSTRGQDLIYKTHDNGGRPFRVVIKGGAMSEDDGSPTLVVLGGDVLVFNNYTKSRTPMLTEQDVEKVFVGRWMEKLGKACDGNSILVQRKTASDRFSYVFIGDRIFEFTTPAEITHYISLIGNNDVPYPCAVDARHRCYLMIELVAFDMRENMAVSAAKVKDGSEDPYQWYYDAHCIVGCPWMDEAGLTDSTRRFQNITAFLIGNEQYALTFCPHAKENKEFERLLAIAASDDPSQPQQLSVRFSDGSSRVLDAAAYETLIADFAAEQGFWSMEGFKLLFNTPE